MLQNSQKNIFAGASLLIKLRTGNVKLWEAATGDILQNKLLFCGPATLLKTLKDRCFPLKFAIILKSICECLLLSFI